MSELSPERIARHAHDAGFRGQDLTIAVAVALAESGGDPRAHNPTPPDNSYGLWQINMLGAMGPARRREFGLESNRELFDPAENARAAYEISGRGRSWTPWSTYTSGAYKRHLDRARRGVEAMKRGGSSGGSGGGSRGGGSGGGGFSVDVGVLRDYARRTRDSADDLTALGRRHVREVREIADDSFGRIGKQSGFAEALDNFGAALRKQVKAVARNTDALATSASRSARAYREQDDDVARSLGGRVITGGGEG
ncbi:transglycosylase SLT domain-containing protein [Saccharothrix sp. S26]|uniref:transglycosylase SLT domain-containing protein n=1 Tax=Saccharothrix sp. S26 TaxID=2907215 RepID=UPI001F30F318|nr:transglycosylase SLT domain-containing protein [Saccharothrix sp. S26]MCE6994819.1 transglycosylase SLT domain-containing protein [Saccharothrix sp. S26]